MITSPIYTASSPLCKVLQFSFHVVLKLWEVHHLQFERLSSAWNFYLPILHAFRISQLQLIPFKIDGFLSNKMAPSPPGGTPSPYGNASLPYGTAPQSNTMAVAPSASNSSFAIEWLPGFLRPIKTRAGKKPWRIEEDDALLRMTEETGKECPSLQLCVIRYTCLI